MAIYKKVLRQLGLTFFCVSSLLIPLTKSAYAECSSPLRIGYEHYPPFLIAPEGPIEGGYDYDVLEAIGETLHCETQWIERPWKRHLQEVKNGRIHIATSALLNLERQDYAYFSPVYRFAERTLYLHQDMPGQSLKEFLSRSFKLGLVNGYIYGEILNVEAPEIKSLIEYANSTALNIPKLQKKRVDGVIAERAVFQYHLNKSDARNQIKDTGETLQTTPMHLMISKAGLSQQDTQEIFDAIRKLSQQGRLKEIADKYKNKGKS